MSNKPMLFVDHFGVFNEAQVKAFIRSGVGGNVAYLCHKTHPEWGKGIDKDTLAMYTELGWKTCFNFEGDPTSAAYFKLDQGKRDANDVLTEFDYLGIKPNSLVDAYYSVDYNVQALADLQAIDAYFLEVEDEMKGTFSDGAYGSNKVLEFLFGKQAKSKPKKGWQTIGWSGNRLFSSANLYQYRVDVNMNGVQVDVDKVLASPGYWPVDPPAPPKPLHLRVVLLDTFTDMVTADEAAMSISKLGYKAQVEEA